MIKRLIWTIWTPMSSVLKKADKLNLSHLSVVWDDWRQWVVRTVTTSLWPQMTEDNELLWLVPPLWSEMTGDNELLQLLPPLCGLRWLETMSCYDCYHLSVVWDDWRQWIVMTVTTSLWSEMTGDNELLGLLPPLCGLRWLETMSC